MRCAKVIECSVSDGVGFRTSLFVQGCANHCKGCFNQSTWDFDGGKVFDDGVKSSIIESLSKPYCEGLSVLGGEPLSFCNLKELRVLLKSIKKQFPEKDIWLWTGYHFESLTEEQLETLDDVDVVISEPFDIDLKTRGLKYAGSSNQRMWIHKNYTFIEKEIE